MTRKDIITIPNPILRKHSQRIGVVDKDVMKLAQSMMDATLDWEDHRQNEVGVALAANQIGKPQRIVVVRTDVRDKANRSFKIFINPEIVKREGEQIEAPEGCLSVKDVYGLVPRYAKVKIKALNSEGKPIRLTATGFLARVFQHEIDHTQGKLFIDYVKDDKFLMLSSSGELEPLSKTEVAKRGIPEAIKSHL